MYAEARWQLQPRFFLESGVRWDRQHYTVGQRDDQTSPRVSALLYLDDATELRLGWGRYYQAQEVNELQVSDGVPNYFPAQRARHLVLNLQHGFSNGTLLNLSVYRKTWKLNTTGRNKS